MSLIFDCDGVVVDSTPLHTEAEAKCFRKLGISITPKEIQQRFSGVSDVDVFRILEHERGIQMPTDMADRLETEKKDLFTRDLKLMDGMQSILEEIRDIPSCIASGSSIAMLEFMLKLTGIYSFFAPRIFSADLVTRGKPHPDLFIFASQQLGVRPESCMVIEDSVSGVRAGKAASCFVVGFIGGSHCDVHHATILKDAGADTILLSLRDLPALLRDHDFISY